MYEMKPTWQEKIKKQVVHEGKCPSCNQTMNASARVCIRCGYSLEKETVIETEVSDTVEVVKPEVRMEEPAEQAGLIDGHTVSRQAKLLEAGRLDAERSHTENEYIRPLIMLGISWSVLLVASMFIDVSEVFLMYTLSFWGVGTLTLLIALLLMNHFMGTHAGVMPFTLIKTGALSAMNLGSVVMGIAISEVFGSGIGFAMGVCFVMTLFYVMSHVYFEMEGWEPVMLFVFGYLLPGVFVHVGMILMM
ncbi:hypothetical protein JD969_03075 [Planctomycetota bacterium]|nr:hypothetical protein JD969_03075 [Planctomycetota bacterium]